MIKQRILAQIVGQQHEYNHAMRSGINELALLHKQVIKRSFESPITRDVAEGFMTDLFLKSQFYHEKDFFGGLPLKIVTFLRLPTQDGSLCKICDDKLDYGTEVAEMDCCHRCYHPQRIQESLSADIDGSKCPNCEHPF